MRVKAKGAETLLAGKSGKPEEEALNAWVNESGVYAPPAKIKAECRGCRLLHLLARIWKEARPSSELRSG